MKPVTPVKWRKYELLVDYGLLSRQQLNDDIRRFDFGSVSEIIRDIEIDIVEEAKRGRQFLYVIKLVSANQHGQLPNLRLSSLDELNDAREQLISALSRHSYDELWFCKTRIDESVFSVAGRIAIQPTSFPQSQVIEQVWRCSPRLIETWDDEFPYPYLRAWRVGWRRGFRIEHVHEPRHLPGVGDSLVSEFGRCMRLFYSLERRLELFSENIERCKCSSFSFEYKIVKSTIWFIDWDTKDDSSVLYLLADPT